MAIQRTHHQTPQYFHVLFKANQKFAEVESVDELVPILLSLAKEVTSAEASSFLLYNPDTRTLRFSDIADDKISGARQHSLKQSLEIPIGKGIAGQAAGDRQPVMVNNAQKDPRFFNKVDKLTGFETRSILAVPVLYKDKLLGVIEVINAKCKDCFDASDKDLLVSFSNLAAVAMIRARLLEQRLNQQSIEIQMRAAKKIQALFSPVLPEPKNGSHAWAFSKPAVFVGGDLYDVIPMPDGSWIVYVADVADKGLGAALIMAALWYRIRSEAQLCKDVCGLIEALNRSLHELLSAEGFFVTIFVGRYWPLTGRLEFANGGHLSAIKIDATACEPITGQRGPSLGLSASARYEATGITLNNKQSILLFTDGVTEAMNSKDELFGEERMIQCIKTGKGPPWGRALLNAVENWQANTNQNDDITILEIWRD
jgi:sigma-B regulation protein RsbU (phosphoserine phosphatase)